MRIVVALGGSALASDPGVPTVAAQRASAARAAQALAPLVREHDIVVAYGSGPQVGVLLNAPEEGAAGAHAKEPRSATHEAVVRYLLEEALRRTVPGLEVATLLTCAVVESDDPAFLHPSEPVGPVYDISSARLAAARRSFEATPDTGGYRRVVPSPEPTGILEERVLAGLVEAGVTVIASGGGVPVVLDESGRPNGVEGIVDRDLAAVVLARVVDADALLLLTDVDAVYRDFGRPGAIAVRQLTTDAAREMIAEGAADPGGMGAKLEAACRFAESGGYAVIAALDDAAAAMRRAAGTRVMR